MPRVDSAKVQICHCHVMLPLRVFIGFAGKSAEAAALVLRKFLKEQGWEVVKAPEDIPIGNWEEHTIPALKLADVFLVVYARGSWKSQDLWKEMVYADEHHLTVYPVVADSVDIHSKGFPAILRKPTITRFAAGKVQAKRGEIRVRLIDWEKRLLYHRLEALEPT